MKTLKFCLFSLLAIVLFTGAKKQNYSGLTREQKAQICKGNIKLTLGNDYDFLVFIANGNEFPPDVVRYTNEPNGWTITNGSDYDFKVKITDSRKNCDFSVKLISRY